MALKWSIVRYLHYSDADVEDDHLHQFVLHNPIEYGVRLYYCMKRRIGNGTDGWNNQRSRMIRNLQCSRGRLVV